jgi:hypothetical protein
MGLRHLIGPWIQDNITVMTAAGNIQLVNEAGVVIKKTVGGATQVKLPPAPPLGRRVSVKDGKGDAAANNITVVPAAGTIDGAANVILNTNYGRAEFQYNGTEWGRIT